MTIRTALYVACIFAVLHILLAGFYAAVTPYRTPGLLLGQRDPSTGQFAQVPDVGAPDERQHANYVLRLLEGKGIPILDPKDPNLGENYQSHQPPLFYLLEAGWVKISGTDLESQSQGLRARSLNLLIGAGTVLGAFFLGLWAFRKPEVGLFCAGFVAFIPMNCALSGALSNDPLLFCLSTWALALCARGVADGFTVKLALLTGGIAGLAVLTKTTGIALFPILLLAAFLSRSQTPFKANWIVALLASWAMLVLPWFIRNKSVYGDPLAMSAFNEAFKGSPQASGFIENLGTMTYWVDWVGWWTARSFFGVFGYMDIFINERGTSFTGPGGTNALYRVLLVLTVLCFASWLLALKKQEWKAHSRVQVLAVSFFGIVALLFLRFNAQYFQGQARYLFPAIGPIGIGFAIGILAVARDRWKIALGVYIGVLIALNAYVLSRLPSEFQRRTVLAAMVNQTECPGNDVPLGNGRLDLSV